MCHKSPSYLILDCEILLLYPGAVFSWSDLRITSEVAYFCTSPWISKWRLKHTSHVTLCEWPVYGSRMFLILTYRIPSLWNISRSRSSMLATICNVEWDTLFKAVTGVKSSLPNWWPVYGWYVNKTTWLTQSALGWDLLFPNNINKRHMM
jgi:hypothetical protein